jgi:hypothetical protein
MNITSLRTVVLACAAGALLFAGSNQASAQVSFNIQVGTPPPPPVVEHRWARPYPGAVWIAGHQEWVHGGWVWVAGYYAYPPRHGAAWVPGHYHNGYWFPGHWA